jgi:ferredoxin
MAKVTLEREKCIGCGSCQAVCPKQFKLAEDGKSEIIGGTRDPKNGNDEMEAEKLGCAESASESCPVQCIIIEK